MRVAVEQVGEWRREACAAEAVFASYGKRAVAAPTKLFCGELVAELRKLH